MGLIMDINNPLIQPSSPAYQEYLAAQQNAAQSSAQNTIAAMQKQNEPKPKAVDKYAPQQGFYTYNKHTADDKSGLWDVYTDAWKKIKGYRDEQGVIDYLKSQPAGTKLKQLSRWEHAPETQHQRQTYVNYFLDNDGNLMYQLEKPNYILKPDEGNGLLGGIASVLTGGLSDIVQGNPWGSGQIDAIDSLLGDSNIIGHGLSNLINPVGKQIKDLKQTWDSDASFIDKFSTAFERVADPTRSINFSLGQAGRVLPDWLLDVAPAIGAAIGTYIYPVAGTAIGYGIGSHLGDDRSDGNSDSAKALTGAGLSATAAYAAGADGGSLTDLLSSAAKIGGKALLSGLLSPNGSRPVSSQYAGAISQNAPQAGIDSTQANTIAQTIENAASQQAQATPPQGTLAGYTQFDRALTPYNLRKKKKLIEDDLYPYIA
jgi:hypothetical protein